MASQKNVTAGMFTVTFTPFLSAAVISITRASLCGRANDGLIMIMDGVCWAHKDTPIRSSAVHRFTTFLNTGVDQKFQRHIPLFTEKACFLGSSNASSYRFIQCQSTSHLKRENVPTLIELKIKITPKTPELLK